MPEIAISLWQYVLVAALVVLTTIAFASRTGRAWTRVVIGIASEALRTTSAAAVKLLDWIVPVDNMNGQVSQPRLAMWLVFNSAACVAVGVLRFTTLSPVALDIAAVLVAILVLFNFAYLCGAFFALQESIAYMNGDISNAKTKFRYHREDGSLETWVDKKVDILTFTTILVVIQLTVVLDWLQAAHGVRIFEVQRSLGHPYFDGVVAIVNTLPGVSIVTSGLGWANTVGFASGWGFVVAQSFSLFGALLLIGTIMDLSALRSSLQGLLREMPSKTDMRTPMLLRLRIMRAPGIMNRFIGDALKDPTIGDGDREKLIEAALSRRYYSFIGKFIGLYPSFSERIKIFGSEKIIADLERRRLRYDAKVLTNIIRIVSRQEAWRTSVEDAQRLGGVVLLVTERRIQLGAAPQEVVQPNCVRELLTTLLRNPKDEPQRERALVLLEAAHDKSAAFALLLSLEHLQAQMRARIIRGMCGWIEPRIQSWQSKARNAFIGDCSKAMKSKWIDASSRALLKNELWPLIAHSRRTSANGR